MIISSPTEEREDEDGLDPISIHDSVGFKMAMAVVLSEVKVEG